MESIPPNTPHLGPSASHDALLIEEILHRILILADMATKASCACVCRYWFDTAIHVLWEDIPLRVAVKLLAPISWHRRPDQKLLYALSRGLTPGDWERFFVYSEHVKCVRFGGEISDAVGAMALSRPVLHIFPKLRRVIWKTPEVLSLLESVLVMSPTVTDFQFSVEDGTNGSQRFHAFCQEIQSRLPRLTVLAMGGTHLASSFSASLVGLVGNLQYLEEYRVPRYGLTPRVLVALSRLPRLRRVVALIGKAPTPEHILELESMDTHKLELAEGAFHSLTDLRLPANFRHTRNLLQHAHGPRSLVDLTCDALHHESPGEIRLLFTSIAVMCPQLCSLGLNCISVNSEDAEPLACTWESLRPILQCRSLVELVVRHALPLRITEKELEELACDRPTWKVIKLAPFPSFHLSPRPTVGLSALLPFAQHCLHLTCLGLFIDGDLQLPGIPSGTQFSALTRLELGFSPILEQNVSDVSWFLADMCVTPVAIETEWKLSLVASTPDAELEARASRWRRVQEFQNKVGNLKWIRPLREENARLRGKDARLRKQVTNPDPERRLQHLT